jgi:hypothetical protein
MDRSLINIFGPDLNMAKDPYKGHNNNVSETARDPQYTGRWGLI